MNRAKRIALVLAVLCWTAALFPAVTATVPPASGAFRFIPDDGGDPDDVYSTAPPRDREMDLQSTQVARPQDPRLAGGRKDIRVRDYLRGVITYILVRL